MMHCSDRRLGSSDIYTVVSLKNFFEFFCYMDDLSRFSCPVDLGYTFCALLKANGPRNLWNIICLYQGPLLSVRIDLELSDEDYA